MGTPGAPQTSGESPDHRCPPQIGGGRGEGLKVSLLCGGYGGKLRHGGYGSHLRAGPDLCGRPCHRFGFRYRPARCRTSGLRSEICPGLRPEICLGLRTAIYPSSWACRRSCMCHVAGFGRRPPRGPFPGCLWSPFGLACLSPGIARRPSGPCGPLRFARCVSADDWISSSGGPPRFSCRPGDGRISGPSGFAGL